MFGIDDIFLYPLIGSAAGALLNRKKPLEGALLGGGAGLLGAGLPGLLGPSGAAGGAAGGTGLTLGTQAPGLTMAGGMGLTPPASALTAAAQPASGLAALNGALRDYSPSINAATQAMKLTEGQKKELVPPPPPFPTNAGSGPQTLSNMVSQFQNYDADRARAAEEERRMRRMAMGGMA